MNQILVKIHYSHGSRWLVPVIPKGPLNPYIRECPPALVFPTLTPDHQQPAAPQPVSLPSLSSERCQPVAGLGSSLPELWRKERLVWTHLESASEVTQSCLALCGPTDRSPPGSSLPGILQARRLEWAAMPSSRGLPDPGIEPRSPALQADSLPAEPPGKTEAKQNHLNCS